METYATTKGQIVIPSKLRRKFGIKVGTKIVVEDNGDCIVLKPITEAYLARLQGSLQGRPALESLLLSRSGKEG